MCVVVKVQILHICGCKVLADELKIVVRANRLKLERMLIFLDAMPP